MRLQDCFPYQICVNLAGREDRRREVWRRFAGAGLVVDRQPGISKQWVRDTRGFMSPSRYACSLAKRLAIRRGKLAGAPAVLLFEDDVVLAPDLHERLAEIDLPDDWGIFFLGCKHLERPEAVAPGLVRVIRAADHHAMAVRAEFIGEALQGLAGFGKGSPPLIPYSDVKMASIQRWIPTYAAYPNLAWQAVSHSENANRAQSYYDKNGRQISETHAVEGLDGDMERLQSGAARNGQPGGLEVAIGGRAQPDELLEMGAGETSGAAPGHVAAGTPMGPSLQAQPKPASPDRDIPPSWSFLQDLPARICLEEMFPLRRVINLGRREDRRFEAEYQFALHGMAVERLAAVEGRGVAKTRGHGPPAKYACRLSHRLAIRSAKLRKAPAVLVFEDDVVLHARFRELAEALTPPPDWGVIFFGCTHVTEPEAVAPGWVRITEVWSTHAYAVRRKWYAKVLAALRRPGTGAPGDDLGADVVISALSSIIPMYAVYPNLAWQNEGYSDLMAEDRKPFRDDGHQNRILNVLRRTNAEMRMLIEHEHGPVRKETDITLAPEMVWGARQPADWRFEDVFPRRLYINLDHRTDRRDEVERQLAGQNLEVTRFCAVTGTALEAGGRLSSAQIGCALSHCAILEAAARDEVPTVLIFEDDVVLHPKFREWCEGTHLPADWGLVYFGCHHVVTPIEAVAPGLVRVSGAFSTHAYAVRGPWLAPLAAAIRAGLGCGRPTDVVLAGLHQRIPTYAFYPNLAWQASGFSDLKQAPSGGYFPDGVQRWHRGAVLGADDLMRRFLRERGIHLWRQPEFGCAARDPV